MKTNCIVIGIFLLSLLSIASSVLAENLVIAGTGDSQGILGKLAALFESQNQGDVIEVPDSIGSGGGIKAIQQHKVGLARTARPMKEKERKEGLTEILFARSPIVFVTHPEVSVNNVSTPHFLDIVVGKITNWQELDGPDHKLYFVDREEGDSSRIILNKHLAGFEDLNSVGKTYFTTNETALAISQHSFTFGYLPLSVALEYKLNILNLDGRGAIGENPESENYPLLTPFYLIQSSQSGQLAKRFMDFIFSKEARELMIKNGVFPVPAS